MRSWIEQMFNMAKLTVIFLVSLLLITYSRCQLLGNIDGTESHLRPGYGMLYEDRGTILQGLNKYHLLLGLQIPVVNFRPLSTSGLFNCSKYDNERLEETFLSALTKEVNQTLYNQYKAERNVNKPPKTIMTKIWRNFKSHMQIGKRMVIPIPTLESASRQGPTTPAPLNPAALLNEQVQQMLDEKKEKKPNLLWKICNNMKPVYDHHVYMEKELIATIKQ